MATEHLELVDRIDELLELTYRSESLGNLDDPLEEVIYILLSRQTQERGYQKAYSELRRKWPTWQALMSARTSTIARVIGPAGFGPTRAKQIKSLLRVIRDECQRRGEEPFTLHWLDALEDAEVESFLSSLPGVGPKSARCVMHYSMGRDVLAVDTHVRRILDRLGVVADAGGKVDHRKYESAIPVKFRKRLHVNLVHHGRAVCRATSPSCSDCSLVSFCPVGRTRVGAQPSKGPIALELFAGGGGMSEGFARAGFTMALAVENDRHAAQTYRVNHRGTVVLEMDALDVTGEVIRQMAPAAAAPDVIIAGPPCQGYSTAGRRQADDSKNVLYRAVTRLAAELEPRYVVIENVPGMRRVQGRSFVEAVLTELEFAGYNADEHLLRACDYGVPQLRKRLVFLAQRRDRGAAPLPPSPTHCPGERCEAGCGEERGRKCGRVPTPTVLDVLEDLPPLGPGELAEYRRLEDGRILLNGSTMMHEPRVITKIEMLEPGDGPISYRRLHDDLARTIVAGHRALPVHPYLNRTISVREAARIQGFDDDHVFAGPRSRQPLQVANAVPPPLAEAIACDLAAEIEFGSVETSVSA